IDGADISNNYYDISWYSTVVMNKGLTQKDFVSGYAMTNKYEDFAESLTYYVFHNDDFVVKMQDSDILKKKYSFIKNVIFSDESFIGTDFSLNNTVKSYYRDITKIDFSKKNFLQYVKNSI
ncbi:putative zinc-binding metallopeptidase, partial [Candidatus Gracilibacteria bacterium]|nr:putative zinc-binding metallopeptidase [Candidatus Gracilibacteria bacterium]